MEWNYYSLDFEFDNPNPASGFSFNLTELLGCSTNSGRGNYIRAETSDSLVYLLKYGKEILLHIIFFDDDGESWKGLGDAFESWKKDKKKDDLKEKLFQIFLKNRELTDESIKAGLKDTWNKQFDETYKYLATVIHIHDCGPEAKSPPNYQHKWENRK